MKICKSRYLFYNKSCTINSCYSIKNKTKLESFTQKSKNLLKDLLDKNYFYQYQTTLNWINFNNNMQTAMKLIKQFNIFIKKLIITLAANTISQILMLQWV